MILYVLNDTLEVIGLVEDYYSLIWTERYYECGEFEVEVPLFYKDSSLFDIGNILKIEDSDVYMIIEDQKSIKDPSKDSLLVTGLSVDGVLKRRWIWTPTNVYGNAETFLYTLVIYQCVTPTTDTERAIPLLGSTVSQSLYSNNYYEQFDLQSIYDICVTVSKFCNFGFRVVRVGNASDMKFEIYKGLDRSARQSDRDVVTFSERYDNVLNGSHYISEKDRVNLVYVLTNDATFPINTVYRDGYWWMTLTGDEPEGLSRHEKSITFNIDRGDPPLQDLETLMLIRRAGLAEINDADAAGFLEVDVDINGMFKYGVDFFLGDLVQTEFNGVESPARVIELVRSYSNSGVETYVTMDFVDISHIDFE